MITITTETKRFTLETDSDQSDKLFNEIVCRLIGRKPSGGGAVMNAKRIAQGKTKQLSLILRKQLSCLTGKDLIRTDLIRRNQTPHQNMMVTRAFYT